MRTALGFLLELAGFGCILVSLYFVTPLLALGVLGIGLVLAAQTVRPKAGPSA